MTCFFFEFVCLLVDLKTCFTFFLLLLCLLIWVLAFVNHKLMYKMSFCFNLLTLIIIAMISCVPIWSLIKVELWFWRIFFCCSVSVNLLLQLNFPLPVAHLLLFNQFTLFIPLHPPPTNWKGQLFCFVFWEWPRVILFCARIVVNNWTLRADT